METPNLFQYATKELSQDAFICWLAAWADPRFRKSDPALHATGTAFVKRLLQVGKSTRPTGAKLASITIKQQESSVDVLMLPNDDLAIIVEDKTSSMEHSDQLRRYKETIEKHYPERQVVCVYFKTGDQCSYEGPEEVGYGCFLRKDFLKILKKGRKKGIEHKVFCDFHDYLSCWDKEVESFAKIKPKDWEPRQWQGFFMALRQVLGDGRWYKPGHGGGGTFAYVWKGPSGSYVALQKRQLRFKVDLGSEPTIESKLSELRTKLAEAGNKSGMIIAPATSSKGKKRTIAKLQGDFLQTDSRSRLDLDLSVSVIRKAKTILDETITAL